MEADRLYVKRALNSTEGKKEHNKVPKPKQNTENEERGKKWPGGHKSVCHLQVESSQSLWSTGGKRVNLIHQLRTWCQRQFLKDPEKGFAPGLNFHSQWGKKKKSVSKVKYHCCLQICQIISESLVTKRNCSMRPPVCLVILKTEKY